MNATFILDHRHMLCEGNQEIAMIHAISHITLCILKATGISSTLPDCYGPLTEEFNTCHC